MSNNSPRQEDIFGEKSQINFKVLAAKLISNWYWFVLSVLTCLSISYLYLRYTTPIYKSSAKILITSDKTSGSGDEGALVKALGGQIGDINNIEGEAEILKTRLLMEKVVRELKSYITYYYKGQVRSVDIYKYSPFTLRLLGSPDSIHPVSLEVQMKGNLVTLSNKNYQKEVNLYQPFNVPGLGKVQVEKGFGKANPESVYLVKVASIKQTAGTFQGNLSVAIPNKQVNILSLDFTHPVPENAEDVLNKLIEVYVQGNLQDKNRIADSTIAFIDSRLVYVGQELGNIEGNVQTFKQKNKLTDISAQSGQLITSTSQYVEELAKVETQISILNSIEKYLTDAKTNQRIVPSGALLEDPNFATLVERYNAIVLEKERSSLSQTEDNPYMQNLNTQIAGARTDMLSGLRSLRKNLMISKEKIQSRSDRINEQVRNVPAVERTYLDLARQQQIKQELYVFLMQKREETAISKTSNISNCKIIEPPVSFGPITPVRTNVLGYGFVLGLFIPFGIIFLGDRLNTKVLSRNQILNHTQAAIIGEIGNSGVKDQAIIVAHNSRTPISEQFRSLRTNLSFFLKEDEKTILLTSSMSGEGKSFISLNLATVLAISGKKVLVMEMDLRKPNLSVKLNLKNDLGFTNYIINKKLVAENIIKTSGTHENLYVISSGNIPPNPSEIILNERTDLLMKELVEKFDYIIIDAPPVGMVTDAQLLSKHADLTLYIVRQSYTHKDQLRIAQEIYANQRMKHIAILVNDVKNDASYGYGYGYGYGYDNGRNIVKKGFFSRLFKG